MKNLLKPLIYLNFLIAGVTLLMCNPLGTYINKYKIPVFLDHLQIPQKMEEKRYGVKIFLIKELKLFQLWRKKRRTIPFLREVTTYYKLLLLDVQSDKQNKELFYYDCFIVTDHLKKSKRMTTCWGTQT
jgi:hypothetical protein